MKNSDKPVFAQDLRANLKTYFSQQLEQIPAYLEELPTKEKLDYLLKLMPYVLPKVNTIAMKNGEPDNWSYNP